MIDGDIWNRLSRLRWKLRLVKNVKRRKKEKEKKNCYKRNGLFNWNRISEWIIWRWKLFHFFFFLSFFFFFFFSFSSFVPSPRYSRWDILITRPSFLLYTPCLLAVIYTRLHHPPWYFLRLRKKASRVSC